MLRFLRSHGPHLTAEQQNDLFAFNKLSSHGFPHQPTCIAYDDVLNIFAIGQRNGTFRVYGTPGFELTGKHDNDVELREIYFINGRGQIITLTDDHCLYLWEINELYDKTLKTNTCKLEIKHKNKNYINDNREGNIKDITAISIDLNNNFLFIGTKNGNIYTINLSTFEDDNTIIYQDIILQTLNTDEHKRVNPGEVESILTQPGNNDNILIGYHKGLIILWSLKLNKSLQTFSINQQLESLCWSSNGNKFTSSHNDGSFITWNVFDEEGVNQTSNDNDSPKIPYGPFSCKPITKIIRKTASNGEDMIIFKGGMPRAAYGDNHTVSIIQGSLEIGKHQVLDISSKVIDFFVIDEKTELEILDNPISLIILSEQELIAIDLKTDGWPQFRLPYLWSIHCSAITCSQFVTNVSNDVFDKIVNAGNKSKDNQKYSTNNWTINGGKIDEKLMKSTKDILITGYEDGNVRFWSIGQIKFELLCTVNTSKLFIPIDEGFAAIDDDDVPLENDENKEEEIEWPPFRKVGIYDPFSDDILFALRKISFCKVSGVLVVGGTAGQIVVFENKPKPIEKSLSVISATLITESDGFTWKGCKKLSTTSGNIKFEVGYQPKAIIQMIPPASIASLTICSEWSLLAAGTSHGFILMDLIQNKLIFQNTTIKLTDMNDSVSGGDALISRRKSFKKSLRESFRRLRKGRSQRDKKASPSNSSPNKDQNKFRGIEVIQLDQRTIERQVEAKPNDDIMGSVVRCFYFVKACISAHSHNVQTPTLWVGLNSGLIYIYSLNIPEGDKRINCNVTCTLGKELQLKHKAPVIYIHLIDSSFNPINDFNDNSIKSPLPQQATTSHGTISGPNKVLICSEEQFKIFNLPNLKPYCKSKLTAHEGSRARKIGISKFVSKNNENVYESCLYCLTNQGDIGIYTLHDLRKQSSYICTKREDINGITSLLFNENCEGIYLQSTSEFKKFSLSARLNTKLIYLLSVDKSLRTPKVKDRIQENEENVEATSSNNMAEINQSHEPDSPATEPSSSHESAIDENLLSTDSGIVVEVTNNGTNVINNQNTTINDSSIVNSNSTVAQTETTTVTNDSNNVMMNGSNEQNETHIISTLGEISRLTNDTSIDMTIDSVKDYLGNMSIGNNTGNSLIMTSSPSNNNNNNIEVTPIINSHED